MAFQGTCKRCKDLKYIAKGICFECMTREEKNAMYQKQNKKRKPIDKRRKPTGEGKMHARIMLTRKRVCTGCGEKLFALKPINFSHTIRKADDESLRLVDENIELECEKCHDIWDKGTWEQIIKQKNFTKRMAYIKKMRPDIWKRKAFKILEFTGIDITEKSEQL